MTDKPRIYLAGPDIFFFEAAKDFSDMRSICQSHGLQGVTPLDGDPLPEGLTKMEQARIIYERNVALIDSAQGLIANISPFRGIAMDPGTAFEIGYAIAKGLPVITWTTDDRDYLIRVSGAYGGNLRKGDDGVWRDPSGIEVEDFGLPENLMITASSDACKRAPANHFEEAVRRMAESLSG